MENLKQPKNMNLPKLQGKLKNLTQQEMFD